MIFSFVPGYITAVRSVLIFLRLRERPQREGDCKYKKQTAQGPSEDDILGDDLDMELESESEYRSYDSDDFEFMENNYFVASLALESLPQPFDRPSKPKSIFG